MTAMDTASEDSSLGSLMILGLGSGGRLGHVLLGDGDMKPVEAAWSRRRRQEFEQHL